jgi:hypothetical protein
VADDTETGSSSSEDTAPSNAELEQRVSGVESKLDLILEKLSGSSTSSTSSTSSAPATDPPAEHGSIAEQIRAQLAERDQATADKASKDAAEQRVKSLEDRLAGMAEQTPQPPERRIERIMWGAR